MNQRFRDVKRIFRSALERDPTQRHAYLADACQGVDSLRKEVESLLDAQSEAEDFFQAPLYSDAMLPGEGAPTRTDFTGLSISHFKILEKIGEGGMGVVYKAHDVRLDRPVALKLLTPEKVADPERMRRFVLEAKAASALNHPNIVTIYDIDTVGGVAFIAMEFVNGQTLDRLIRGRRIAVTDALRLGAQVADALNAAHAAGIVHRDIKPANIMVTDSGLVKVLDFGVAKLTESSNETEARDAERGGIVGTVPYMSPEQALGEEVDARSDVFSLGSVLYEMSTGIRAFSKATNQSTLQSILGEEPKPIREFAPAIPPALEALVSRCLRKDPRRRFQRMADLKGALEQVSRAAAPGAAATVGLPALRRRQLAVMSGILVAAAALSVAVWLAVFSTPVIRLAPRVGALTVLPGTQIQPALSPDGKRVAFAWNGERFGSYNVYVQTVGDSTPRRLTVSDRSEYNPTWSPDGLQIAFLRANPVGMDVVAVPAAGGAERRLAASQANCSWLGSPTVGRMFCGVSWSPNGKHLAFTDRDSPDSPQSIFLFDIDRHEKRRLTSPPRGFEDGLSVFSPDGRMLAFSRNAGFPLNDIYVLRLSENGRPEGSPRQLTSDNAFIEGMGWTADGRGVVFASSRDGTYGLWRVPSLGGRPVPLAVGRNGTTWPSISRTGDRLVFCYGSDEDHIWRTPVPPNSAFGTAAAPTRLTNTALDEQPTLSSDGQKLAWDSGHSGSNQIWVSNGDGSQPVKLTDLGFPGADAPRWSPDGRYIAFRGFSPWPTHAYVVAAEGGRPPRRVTAGDFREDPPNWSRDGRSLYFRSDRGDGDGLWKVPLSGTPPVLIARDTTLRPHSVVSAVFYGGPAARRGGWPMESSDGRFVYYGGPGATVWKIPSDGGSPILLAGSGKGPFFESTDGKLLYFSGPDTSIRKVPTAGGEAKMVAKAGQRTVWTHSAAGIYFLDPDAKGGPALEFVSFMRRRSWVVRLPGQSDSYVGLTGGALTVSPDQRWAFYLYSERSAAQVMLVDHFR